MKWLFTLVFACFTFQILNAQIGKVGINTTEPAALLHVNDSSVVFTGAATLPGSPGNPPVSGAGTRMMWYPDKAAFRAGHLTGAGVDYWNKVNIGTYSIAMGYNTKAIGEISTALGYETIANGSSATAMGVNTTAGGGASTAMGFMTIANGDVSTAMGNGTLASGGSSSSLGELTTASGTTSTAMGKSTIASGSYSTALGNLSKATANTSISMGLDNEAKCYGGTVVGLYNEVTAVGSLTTINSNNRIFQIGNGFSSGSRSNAMTVLQNGKVGINTTLPAAVLHVKDSSVVFTGAAALPGSPGNPPISGAGTRMMWYPDKAAFRVGKVEGTGWDKNNIGLYSIAMGENARAESYGTVALGSYTIASNTQSIAMGNGTIASGANSTAMGKSTTASGTYSTAMGYGTSASGIYSTAMGYYSHASGAISTAIGASATASGTNSIAMGLGAIASGANSIAQGNFSIASAGNSAAMGLENEAKCYAGIVVGLYNDNTAVGSLEAIDPVNRIFQIGNGTTVNTRKNAMTVLQNGKVGINTTLPAALLHVKDSSVVFTGLNSLPGTPGNPPVSGAGTRMMWYPDKAAFRVGNLTGSGADYWNKDNIGIGSIAMGYNTKAIGLLSIAMGSETAASGSNSTAIGFGTTASGGVSIAMGYNAKAIGDATTSMGLGNHANCYAGTVVGLYNDNTTVGSLIAIDPVNRIFQIGNGTASNARNNAMTVLQNGKTGINTTIPQAMFHLVRNGVSGGTFDVNSSMIVESNTNSFLQFSNSNNTESGLLSGNAVTPYRSGLIFGPDSSMIFRTGGNINRMKIAKDGNIGIGMTTPGFLLNFSASLGDKISLWGSSGNHYGFGIQSGLLQIHSDVSNTDVAIGYGSSSSFTETMRIKGNGNVGIGITTPSLRLHVAKNTNYGMGDTYGIAATNATDPNLRLNLGYDGTIDAAIIQASQEGNTFNKKLLLNPIEGNVGVGIISPDYLLDVGGRIRLRYGQGETAGIWLNKNDNSNKSGFIGTFTDDTYIGLYGESGAGWSLLMNTTNGNIGIGTTTPSEKLNVAGNGLFTGTVTANCGVLVCSDIRYKKNILPIHNALISLQSIHGIYYHWDNEKFSDKNFGDERQLGFSAQELEAVYPEMVKTDPEGFKTVDYSRLTPVLVEAIKEQQSQIEQLQNAVHQLMQEIQVIRKDQ